MSAGSGQYQPASSLYVLQDYVVPPPNLDSIPSIAADLYNAQMKPEIGRSEPLPNGTFVPSSMPANPLFNSLQSQKRV